jgi:hypothetical protein
MSFTWIQLQNQHQGKGNYNRITTRDSAIYKLRKNSKAEKLKEVCQLGSKPVIVSLSSSLKVEITIFLASVIRDLWS